MPAKLVRVLIGRPSDERRSVFTSYNKFVYLLQHAAPAIIILPCAFCHIFITLNGQNNMINSVRKCYLSRLASNLSVLACGTTRTKTKQKRKKRARNNCEWNLFVRNTTINESVCYIHGTAIGHLSTHWMIQVKTMCCCGMASALVSSTPRLCAMLS